MHMNEVHIKLLGEDLLHLLRLAFAQKAMVDKHAGHLLTNGAGAERGHHRGVNAARKRQNHAVAPHLLADLGHLPLGQIVHRPRGLQPADVKEEVGENLLTKLRMAHLGMELGGIQLALSALHGGDGAHGGAARNHKPLGHAAHGIAMAHPHRLLHRCGVKQGRDLLALDGGRAVLSHLGVSDLAAQGHRHNLVAVAKTEHRQAQVKDGRIDRRSILSIYRCGTA